MEGLIAIFISCVLFIHMGLGKAIKDFIGCDFIILGCAKCLTFWCSLFYSLLFTNIQAEWCIAIAFILAYFALWLTLLLDVLSCEYEEYYNQMGAKSSQDNERDRNGRSIP